ncbi:sulfate reduction electron transfer complex DsrMKJOP subunit DsrJ [bacterium]|nr:sulfate reduction electron transfer complex DsrMKJOP subunit DsrJ [bacterium]
MYDKGKIIAGLIIFLGLAALPFFYSRGQTSAPEPDLDTPAINQMSKKECVESADFMRANHMKLLDEWRNSAVREGDREYGVIDGVEYDKSLQNTCMRCHSNKKDFCDRCHNYASVKPYCWNCHIAPE